MEIVIEFELPLKYLIKLLNWDTFVKLYPDDSGIYY